MHVHEREARRFTHSYVLASPSCALPTRPPHQPASPPRQNASSQTIFAVSVSVSRRNARQTFRTHHRLAVQWELVHLLSRRIRTFDVMETDESLTPHPDIPVCRNGQNRSIRLEQQRQRFCNDCGSFISFDFLLLHFSMDSSCHPGEEARTHLVS